MGWAVSLKHRRLADVLRTRRQRRADERYLAQNPDVAATLLTPIEHYERIGGREGRRRHPLFDGAWYLV